MAIKQFAIPLNGDSNEEGDIHFRALVDAGTSAIFELSNAGATTVINELNLITKKNGTTKDHKFNLSFGGGSAKTTLTNAQLSAVQGDASGGDWDYVEAKWTVGQVDTPGASNMYAAQDNRSYNAFGWPPND